MPQTRRGGETSFLDRAWVVTEPSPRRPGAEQGCEAGRAESSQQLEWKASPLSAGRKRDPDVPLLAPRLAHRTSTFLAQLPRLRSQEQLLRAEGEAPAIWAARRVCVRVCVLGGAGGGRAPSSPSTGPGTLGVPSRPPMHTCPPRGSGSAAGWYT